MTAIKLMDCINWEKRGIQWSQTKFYNTDPLKAHVLEFRYVKWTLHGSTGMVFLFIVYIKNIQMFPFMVLLYLNRLSTTKHQEHKLKL